MTSEVTPLRTPAETGLEEAFTALHEKLPEIGRASCRERV
jgi:hypothetical protein